MARRLFRSFRSRRGFRGFSRLRLGGSFFLRGCCLFRRGSFASRLLRLAVLCGRAAASLRYFASEGGGFFQTLQIIAAALALGPDAELLSHGLVW